MNVERIVWVVTRVVEEKFEVDGMATREEALAQAENPYSVRIIREGARKRIYRTTAKKAKQAV